MSKFKMRLNLENGKHQIWKDDKLLSEHDNFFVANRSLSALIRGEIRKPKNTKKRRKNTKKG